MKKLVLFLQTNQKNGLELNGQSIVSALIVGGSFGASSAAESLVELSGSSEATSSLVTPTLTTVESTTEELITPESGYETSDLAKDIKNPNDVEAQVDSKVKTLNQDVLLNVPLVQILQALEKDIEQQNIRTTLIIPDEEVLNCELKVPARQFKQIQKALPYLIEDQVASDPDDCFIAVGEHKNDILKCSVLERDNFSKLYDALYELNLSPEKIFIDASLLQSTAPAIYVIHDRAILINQQAQSFAFEIELLDIYLDKLKTQVNDDSDDGINNVDAKASKENEVIKEKKESVNDDAINSLAIEEGKVLGDTLVVRLYSSDSYDASADNIKGILQSYKAAHGLDYHFEFETLSENDFYTSVSENALDRSSSKSIINLMQGEFKARRLSSGFSFDVNWKPPVILLLIFLFFHLGFIAVENYRYKDAAKNIDEKTKQVFKEIFPKTRNYSRMQTRVKGLITNNVAPSENVFLELFAKFSEAMNTVNSKNKDSLVLDQARYEQSNAEMKLDLIALDFESLNRLKEISESNGMLLDIESTNAEKSGVKGRVKIQLNPDR